MLAKDFKISSFLPPGLVVISGIKYIMPGWHVVPSMTTLNDVYNHWTRDLPIREKEPAHLISTIISSSNGKSSYNVTFDGIYWNCDCAGFGFRKKCRHVTEVKTKQL